jgi:hypothetical protein
MISVPLTDTINVLPTETTNAFCSSVFWRVWHLRNDAMHGKGTTIVRGSMEFLTGYVVSLNIAEQAGWERGPK